MEIVSQDGSITEIKPGQTTELGRNQGLNSSDQTISRRHLLLTLSDECKETSLQFEVVGKNPIYVNKGNEVQIFRRFERGELGYGDMFSFLGKEPVWFTLRETESCSQSVRRNDLAGKLESDVELTGVDEFGEEGGCIPGLDPVKEFGLVVIGHEFDSYPKKMIKDFKNWDWFLEEKAGIDSEDEDQGVKRSGKRKRKKGEENDDEEWAGESDDDKEMINKTKKAQKPSYTTRSKDRGKSNKDKNKNKGDTPKKETREIDEEDVEDEDEEDETLGGFIVDDEGLEVEDEVDDDDEEELGDDLDVDDE